MRILFSFITVLGLIVSLGGVMLAQDTSADEEAIRQLDQRYGEAWNNRDAKALAELFTEDADFIDVDGETITGRTAIEEDFAEAFSSLPEGARLDFEVVSLRFVRPNIAVTDGPWAITGLPETEEAEPAEGLYTSVYIKKDGQWLLAADRSRVPVVPPSAEEE